MRSAPGSELLPAAERQRLATQFEKDLGFIQLIFRLLNQSCAIKDGDLVWSERGAAPHSAGAMQAAGQACLRLLRPGGPDARPLFCQIVNDYARHEAESCALSDAAAEERIRKTGSTEVYRCNFGLLDIAVPVVCEGHHVATFFAGQRLSEPPTPEGFEAVVRGVAGLDYINLEELEKAYYAVGVVTEADIKSIVQVLEAFAEYLANSWNRVAEAVREEQRKTRERQLCAKEFAFAVLEGGGAEHPELRDLTRKMAFSRYPNRVLVVKLESTEGSAEVASAAVLQAVEEVCEKLDNAAAAHLRRSGVCIFCHDEGRSDAGAIRIARRVQAAVAERCGRRVRIGIGTAKEDWKRLSDSYHEACIALAESSEGLPVYHPQPADAGELSGAVERIREAMAARKLDDARLVVASLPLLISRLSEGAGVGSQKTYFASCLEQMCRKAQELGVEAAALSRIKEDAAAELQLGGTPFEVQEACLRSAGYVLDELRRLHSGKRQKIVERATDVIERHLARAAQPQEVSLAAVAAAVGISPSHLSRTFRQVTGDTFERCVMVKRIELAKRLLLEPLNNVSQVAEKCGFSDPSYFARVFRKIAECSPKEYCQHPGRFAGSTPPT